MSEISLSSESPQLQHNFKGHKQNVISLSFHPEGTQLASSSNDKTVMMWNFTKQTRCYKFLGHESSVTCVDYSSDGKLLASASQDCTVRLWIPTVRGECSDFRAHTSTVRTVAFSPDDKKVHLFIGNLLKH